MHANDSKNWNCHSSPQAEARYMQQTNCPISKSSAVVKAYFYE